MNNSGYGNLPEESTPEETHKRRDSTRDLNGSYILACRGEESLENSTNDARSPSRVSQNQLKFHRDYTVYTSIAMEDSDEDSTDVRHKRSRIIHDSIADKSLPNPSNITDAPLCRICHEGDEEEDLMSPCFCSGSVGALHMSCLERWLGASDKTRCEICEFQFSIRKKPKPFIWFLKNKALGKDRRYLLADIGCAMCFAPFTIGAFTGCMIGASYFTSLNKDWQATTLILLAMTNLLIFFLWCGFTIRRNYILCLTWRESFQEIKIKYNPPDKNNNSKPAFSRGPSITERVLLENKIPAIPVGNHSPENDIKSFTRKVTYETSPKHTKNRCQLDEEDDSHLKPGTPYPKRKHSSDSKHKRLQKHNSSTENNTDPNITDLEPNNKAKNKHLDILHNNSTSTPAVTSKKPRKHNIFDENHCSATPIQGCHYASVSIQNMPPDFVYGNASNVHHSEMFVETPITIFSSNMASDSTARRGLLFQHVSKEVSHENCSVQPPENHEKE